MKQVKLRQFTLSRFGCQQDNDLASLQSMSWNCGTGCIQLHKPSMAWWLTVDFAILVLPFFPRRFMIADSPQPISRCRKKAHPFPTGHELRVFGREIMNKLHLVTIMAWFLAESCIRFTQKEHPFSAAGGDLSTADGTLPRRFVGHLKSTQGSLFRICASGKPLGRDGSEFVFVDSSSKETRVGYLKKTANTFRKISVEFFETLWTRVYLSFSLWCNSCGILGPRGMCSNPPKEAPTKRYRPYSVGQNQGGLYLIGQSFNITLSVP